MNNLKKILFGLSISLFGFSFDSQSQEWQSYVENESIRIEIKQERCTSPENGTDNTYVLLKITNKLDQKITVNFHKFLWYNEVCASCVATAENLTSVVLNPNESQAGSCEADKTLKIFQAMHSGFSNRVLTDFELNDLKITIEN